MTSVSTSNTAVSKGIDIALDDLILFFQKSQSQPENRLLKHKFYTDKQFALERVETWWDHTVVAQSPPRGNEAGSPLVPGDLVLNDPQNATRWLRIPKESYLGQDSLGPRDVVDLEFMATHEGVLLANVPKLQLTGCTCYLLNLLALRSAPLEGYVVANLAKLLPPGDEPTSKTTGKTTSARHAWEQLQRAHARDQR